MVSFWRSASSNSLYDVRSGATSASSNRSLCTHRSKKVAARLFAMSLGPYAPTMDLSRPNAGVSCSQSRGSNGNHDMFAVASFIGRLPRGRGQSPGAADPAPGGRLLLAHAQLHHLGRFTTDDLVHTIGPALQRDRNFVGVVVLLIDANDAAERPRHMIECFLDHRHRDPELLHAAGAGPAQIMKTPATRGNPCLGTDPVLHLVPVVHRPLTVSAEHEVAVGEPRARPDQRPGLPAQRDRVWPPVFGALGR